MKQTTKRKYTKRDTKFWGNRGGRKRVLVDSETGKPVAMLKGNAVVQLYRKKPYVKTERWYKAHDRRTIELNFLQWLINHDAISAVASANRSVYVPHRGRPSKQEIAMRYLKGLVGGTPKRGRPITAKGLMKLLVK